MPMEWVRDSNEMATGCLRDGYEMPTEWLRNAYETATGCQRIFFNFKIVFLGFMFLLYLLIVYGGRISFSYTCVSFMGAE